MDRSDRVFFLLHSMWFDPNEISRVPSHMKCFNDDFQLTAMNKTNRELMFNADTSDI